MRIRSRVRASTVANYRGRRVVGTVAYDPPDGWLVEVLDVQEVTNVRQWKKPTLRQLKWSLLDQHLKEQKVMLR